jgi:uncharacterized protein YkwD
MALPTDGRPRLRRTAAALAMPCAALALAAPAAGAAPLSLRVVNQRGVEQASLVSIASAACGGSCGTTVTDGRGRLSWDASPGDTLTATRGAAAPEGAGVSYVVPNPVPASTVTVTLPALPGTVSPGIDADERWLFERVNGERAALGRSALALSSTLSRAADAYAHYLLSTGQFDHLALADPGVRAVDQGWPVPGGNAVGETLALAPSRDSALQGWKSSSPHWTLLMMAGLDSVGVARAGDRWVMMPALCQTTAPERCGLGEDPGVVPPGSSGGPGAGGGPGDGGRGGGPEPAGAKHRRPRLRVSVHRHGRRLAVAVRLAKGRGRVHVAVRQRGRRAHLRRHRAGSLYRYVARLPRRGRWTITVRFSGRGAWRDRTLPKRTVRVR